MAVSSLVAASSGKTMYRTTLTSGTSWTVPAGVTYINVTLTGGGGGGGCASVSDGGVTNLAASAGGSTTFTGATTASGGNAGNRHQHTTTYAVFMLSNGTAGSNFGESGKGGLMTAGINVSGYGAHIRASDGSNGQVVSSTLSTTPGASISYSIGAGGTGGTTNGNTGATGGNGAAGKIDIEYWV